MACQAAVEAGDRLSAEEVDYLMRLRPTAEDSHHCPHGRPPWCSAGRSWTGSSSGPEGGLVG
jgi:DNA mismatch repair ATPase MutL